MRRLFSAFLLSAALVSGAQTHPTTSPAHSSAAAGAVRPPAGPKSLDIVAGIVGADGTVKYLPRVHVALMPKGYQNAEAAATATYKFEMDAASAEREKKIAALIQERRQALDEAKAKYAVDLEAAVQKATLDPTTAMPTCLNVILGIKRIDSFEFLTGCPSTSIHVSKPFLEFLTSSPMIGSFDVHTFKAAETPARRDLKIAMAAVPFARYLAIPEFEKAAAFVIKKNSKEIKRVTGVDSLTPDSKLAPEVSAILSRTLANVWVTGSDSASHYNLGDQEFIEKNFAGMPSYAADFLLDKLEKAAARVIEDARLGVGRSYIQEKDQINAHYDSLQRAADDEMRQASDSYEAKRSGALEDARRKFRPLQEMDTSLQGQATITVPAAGGVLYADDVTTDRHLKWVISLTRSKLPKTMELTDANAVPVTSKGSTSVVASSAQQTFPKAAELTAEQKDEYHLRYGTRLMKTWLPIGTPNVDADRLLLVDTPLGFGFSVIGNSGDTYNTLRMDDNKIAVRLFKEKVVPFLRRVPSDLQSTGGENAFQAMNISVLASKKDFSKEYAFADNFFFEYTFRISDVESFAAEKIDTQQLLDRGIVTQEGVGKISLKYAAAE